MKRILLLMLVFAITVSFVGCFNKNISPTTPEDTSGSKIVETDAISTDSTAQETSETKERPYDKNGTLYEEELTLYLSDLGSIYWDVTEEYYVLKPRDTFRQVILGLVKDPFNTKYMEFWDACVKMIQVVTEYFPSAVCVSNPANPKSYLLVVYKGEVGYSAF